MNISDVRNLHIELTTKCNARCPMCIRNISGYPYNAGYPLTEISFNDYKSIFKPEFLMQINKVNFNGNLGDFGVAQDAAKVLHYTADYVTEIQVETNGGMRTEKWWAALVRDNVEIIFALDGFEDTHSLYRIGTTYSKVLSNALAFIKAGGKATWKMIAFDHNKHQIQLAEELSNKLGFNRFLLIDDTNRLECAVFKTDGEFDYWIGKDEPPRGQIQLEQEKYPYPENEFEMAIKHEIPNHMKKIHCLDHLDFKQIYIAGDGSVYPCCFTGSFPQSMALKGNEQLKDLVYENNAIEYGLEHSIQWFDNLYNLWNLPDINSGKPFMCLSHCTHSS